MKFLTKSKSGIKYVKQTKEKGGCFIMTKKKEVKITEEKKALELTAPWLKYMKEIALLFKDDPDIHIESDGENILILRVDDQVKADAISKILPERKEFGNIIVDIKVIPANEEADALVYFERAFAGNPVLAYTKRTGDSQFGIPFSHVVFKKEVVQFFNDDLYDANGICTTLYQEIAKEVFGDCGVHFSTETDDDTEE